MAQTRKVKYPELSRMQEPLLVDVREPAEFASTRLPASINAPLSRLAAAADELDRSRPVVLVCQSGRRAERAAEELERRGFSDLAVLEGGLVAARALGAPTDSSGGACWSLERQVRLAAGSLALTGLGLGALVHPGFYAIAWFVAAGLTFAGLTDTCGMAMLLAHMPWNQRGEGVCRGR